MRKVVAVEAINKKMNESSFLLIQSQLRISNCIRKIAECAASAGLATRVARLREDISILEARRKRISLPEICKAVEQRVCLKVAGSTKLARKSFFNFERFRDAGRSWEIDAVLEPMKITQDLLYMLGDQERIAVHDDRSTLTVAAVEALLDGSSDCECDEKQCFLSALADLGMIGMDGIVDVTDPF